jgi:hypothetical protein
MPQHFPSSVGTDAIRSGYEDISDAITLTVKFKSIKQTAPTWFRKRSK